MSTPPLTFQAARIALKLSAALHLLVILVSGGTYLTVMLVGAVLWTVCAFLLRSGNRLVAALVFLLSLFSAVTVPLGFGLSETGVTASLLLAIVAADLAVAAALLSALWRDKPRRHA